MTVSHEYPSPTAVSQHQELAELSREEREELADGLLRESVERMGRGEYPFYTAAWIRHLSQADANLPLAGINQPQPSLSSLTRACLRLLAQTPMRRENRQALRLRMKGLTFKEIGEQLGVNLSQARRWVTRAIGLLAAAAVDPDELLTQDEAIRAAYWEDSRRYAYHSERHCKVGQEACRHTGFCTRRWYLMHDLD